MVQVRRSGEGARDLSGLVARFEAWRRTRTSRRTRIPEDLWTAAVAASSRSGISRTARVLRLNEQELRRRCGELDRISRTAVPRGPAAGFVELRPAAAVSSTPHWVVELESAVGRLRIEGGGASALDVAALAAAFLRVSS
jgi:hypothetical protein